MAKTFFEGFDTFLTGIVPLTSGHNKVTLHKRADG